MGRRALPWVVAGGALGVAAREGLTLAFPGVWVLLAINVAGALLLGTLIEFLARTGPDDGARRAWRLTLGTGFLGGFTTYSALAFGVVAEGPAGMLAGVATIVLGIPAAALGILVGGRLARGHEAGGGAP